MLAENSQGFISIRGKTISITVTERRGSPVDIELLRPRTWIQRHGLSAGSRLPLNVPELEVDGVGFVTAIDDCSDIADGEGSVVTGRFITRQANDLARVTVARLPPTVQEIISRNALASGSPDVLADLEQLARLGLVDLETLEGTERHPVWSEDQQDWMPLGQLQPGQTLRAADGPAVVLSVTIHNHIVPVYNIEVHGEHVYQVGQFGLLVHNACPLPVINPSFIPLPGIGAKAVFPFAKMMRPIAGAWPAVIKEGTVYVHYMHIAANQLANGGRLGAISHSGWVWLDDLGNVIKVLW
ncbi:MAG: hypothetical protein KF752_05260 [Pirellulaceae bacterium]|nr:hypothetical protein [Pirellulaceae bacterium]